MIFLPLIPDLKYHNLHIFLSRSPRFGRLEPELQISWTLPIFFQVCYPMNIVSFFWKSEESQYSRIIKNANE